MFGYFADMHGGIFTLTAYDDVCIYLYTFKISRHGKDLDFPMVVNCNILSIYQIKFSSLALGTRVLSVAGCFASSPNPQCSYKVNESSVDKSDDADEISAASVRSLVAYAIVAAYQLRWFQ
ncbi:hypothetical protein POM88_024980 [Heracleum sosnowskyi]|uniref:Uncharacterized protein n=1 Tax=Heracleum sosnowskyi TaxID=360622 RepID=A0AAD8I416_9APIA|nr:hypothetical protein POM88_024980 [Heracleum sosnowskyi]